MGFRMVPDWLIDAGVSDGAIRAWIELSRAVGQRGDHQPTIGALAAGMGCTAREAQRRLRELEAAKAVRVEPSAGGPNRYWLVNERGKPPPTTRSPLTPMSPPTQASPLTVESPPGDQNVTPPPPVLVTPPPCDLVTPDRGGRGGFALTHPLGPFGETRETRETHAERARAGALTDDWHPSFLEWWGAFPASKRANEGRARQLWRDLSAEDRRKCLEVVKGYAGIVNAAPDARKAYFWRADVWLRDRHWNDSAEAWEQVAKDNAKPGYGDKTPRYAARHERYRPATLPGGQP